MKESAARSPKKPLEDQTLCSDCVGEAFLSAKIEKTGKHAVCSYCGEQRKTFSLGQIADEIEIALQEHFYQTPIEPEGVQHFLANEGLWNRGGERVVFAIQNYAGISPGTAEDIRKVLYIRHYDKERAEMHEEGPFDKDAQYASQDVDSEESHALWRQFERSLKSESRFFSQNARDTLASIFEGLAEHKTYNHRPILVEAGPGMELSALYRARVFQSSAELKEALKRPDLHIGPPPPRLAISGRMNPHGVAVFYGAEDPLIALAEVRPPIGSRVVIGKFELTQRVRLLDVDALRLVFVDGSVFDRAYKERLEKGEFLRWLSDRISKPVMPDDEPFDYLATQVIAEYLATEATPQLDGIIYPSTQGNQSPLEEIGRNMSNVVLFRKAARVASLDIPEGTEINADLDSWSDDGAEVDYRVYEKVPEAKPSKGKDRGTDDFLFFSEPLDGPGPDYDERKGIRSSQILVSCSSSEKKPEEKLGDWKM
jgi:hypothetical protein